MSENPERNRLAVTLRELAADAKASQEQAREDIRVRNEAIRDAYDSGEWILKDLSEVTGLSIPQVHKAIRKASEHD